MPVTRIPPETAAAAGSARTIRTQRRWMVGLTVGVFLAHALVLVGAPLVMLTQAEPNAPANRAFTTRTIALAPPQSTPVAAAKAPLRSITPVATDPNPAPRQRSASTEAANGSIPKNESNVPEPPVDIAQAAINNVASPAPAPEVSAPAVPATPAVEAPAGAVLHHYAIPGSVRIKYDIKGEIKRFPYFAFGELLWLQDGKTYDARLEISHFLLGSRVQTSTGMLTNHGLEPTRFGDKVRSEVAAHFVRSRGTVTFSANTPDAPLLPGAQDHLSVFMQLAAMLGGEPDRFVAGTEVAFQAVGPRSSEWWVFKVAELEALSLPGGEVKAIKLLRNPTGEYDPKVEVWLAPGMGYLPVRVRLTQTNGDFVEQLWRATQKP